MNISFRNTHFFTYLIIGSALPQWQWPWYMYTYVHKYFDEWNIFRFIRRYGCQFESWNAATPLKVFPLLKNMFAPKWLVLNIWYVRSYTAIEAKVSFCHNGYSIFNDIHNCFYSLAGFQWEFSILTFNNYNYTYVCIFSGSSPLILQASPFSMPLRVLKLLKLHVHTYILLQKY